MIFNPQTFLARAVPGVTHRFAFALVALALFQPGISLALDVYIVRHAETLANVTKEYTAFNQRHFTRKGEQQITALTRALAPHRFDAVIVSPAYRVLRTVQPYLAATGTRAEIWPELDECCWQADRANDRTPPGFPILLEEDQRSVFVLREGAPVIAPGDERFEDSLRRIRWVAAELWRRWGGTDARILVATHYLTGAQLINALADSVSEGRIRLENAKIAHLREVDGRFTIIGINLDPDAIQQAADAAVERR